MRRVELFGAQVSALGFGCASLGSRVSEVHGRAAIDRALSAGVSWFDVAPSYGDGEAERLLGRALRGVDAFVVTKVGLAARTHPLKRLVMRAARPVVAALPGLRAMAKRARGPAAARVPLTGRIVRESLERSLERLGLARVGMLCLHDVAAQDAERDDVREALHDVRRQGLALAIGVASDAAAFASAREAGLDADAAQFANDPFGRQARAASALDPQPRAIVLHSVFGVAGALDRVRAAWSRQDAAARLAALGYADARTGAPRLLLDYAFASNPAGVVLASGFAPAHLAANVAAASAAPDPSRAAAIEAALAD